MRDHRRWTLASIVAVIILMAPFISRAQEVSLREATTTTTAQPNRNVIIIGFVGGFVSRHDTKHPEVQFAAYLRDRYPTIHVDVFGNHHGRKALHQVMNLLDTDHDGILSSLEKEQATVIIYGHSWGATETIAFARELGENEVPVALTVQIDMIAKPGHKESAISPNVARTINFYQTKGPLHGAPEIIAVDAARTKIIGNIEMTYDDRRIDCNNYSWYSRTINKPHHEIENDFRVWDQVASLIDSDLPETPTITPAPSPSQSPFFQYLRRGYQAEPTQTALLEIPGGGDN
jgi:pimeloyl-ACP methyl ester carboxylesterase